MPIRSSACVGLALLLVLGACGSDSGGPSGSGTELEIEGTATLGSASTAPDPDHPDAPLAGSGATEVDISGTLKCDGPQSVGTGMYENTAVDVCFTVDAQRATFDEVGISDEDLCAEVFGGPQHAGIRGVIRGESVDVSVARTDSCGIQDWQRLEFLLGPPER